MVHVDIASAACLQRGFLSTHKNQGISEAPEVVMFFLGVTNSEACNPYMQRSYQEGPTCRDAAHFRSNVVISRYRVTRHGSSLMANGDVELSANGIVSAICGGGTLADRMVWQGAASLGCVEDQWHGGGGNGGAHWVGPRFISGTLRKLHRAYFVDCTEVVPLSRRPDS